MNRIQDHINVLGWLYVVLHALGILAGVLALIIMAGIGLLAADPQAMGILTLIGVLTVATTTLLCLPGLVAGAGLLKRRSWARVLTLVLAFVGLLNFPIGTLLGAYAIWALFQPEAEQIFGASRVVDAEPVVME
ncbi:MAG: hypothetical protein GX605_03105 [Chloroflexi bacterium]|nr:hypothetical protein [Chloroflexota bacterium]